MNRRAFLAALIAGATMDPELALWVPGKKLISIPPPRLNALWGIPKVMNIGGAFGRLDPDDTSIGSGAIMRISYDLIWSNEKPSPDARLVAARIPDYRGDGIKI